MSLTSVLKKLVPILMIVALLTGWVPAVSPLGPSTALAQAEPAFVRRVRAIETSELGIPYPAGLAFSPRARAFYVLEARGPAQPVPSELDILQVTPYDHRGASARITASVRDPINVAYDQKAGRLLIFQVAPNKLIEVQEGPEGILSPATLVRHDAGSFGLQNPQGMAVDPITGHLFVLDASGPRIVRIEPDEDGGFAAAAVSEIDLGQAGLPNVRGLTLDPGNGTFYILSPAEQRLYELTASGQVVTTRDLFGLGLVDPQGVVLAPSADLTDDPGEMSLYIADSGLFTGQTLDAKTMESSQAAGAGNGAAGSGNITEFSFYEIPAAAQAEWTASLVRTIDTSTYNPPSPDPSGLAYVPGSQTLVMCDGEVEETVSGITHFQGVNVWETTLRGAVVDTANISKVAPTVVPMSNEPTGVAWNPVNGHYYFSDDGAKKVFDLDPGGDGEIGTADDTWTSFDTSAAGSGDPEGIAYDSANGRLFVADGVNAEIYEYTLSGTLIDQFDVLAFGIPDPESVEYNPVNDTLFVLSSNSGSPYAVETTKSGALIQTIDVSAASATAAAGLAYAPASDGSGEMRFYIVDRAVDNNWNPEIIDGKMYELTMPPTGSVGPTANDDSAGTLKGIPVTIDVAANDSDLNGNLDPTTTNTTCAYGSSGCHGVSHGSLANHGNGTFTYTPASGYTGEDGFVYEICDTGSLCDTAHVTINVGEAVVDVRVSGSWDDAEEHADGVMDRTSSDLELVFDAGGDQTVGMRFNGIEIPPRANITYAYVQFKVDEASTGATSLIIEGQAIDSAPVFDSANYDISGRARTAAAVAWTPAPWPSVGISGVDQQTPNLAPIIQEIVNRPGWLSGNALMLIITGTGERVAEAYNGDAAGAPLLHVEYGSRGTVNNQPVAVADGYSTAEDSVLSVPLPGVLDNDSDADGDPLTASLVGDVSNGVLTLNANGSFSYTPDADFNGSDSFTYRANDGSVNSGVASVSITVNAVNDAPVAVADGYSTAEDTELSVSGPGVLGNDRDADGDALTASLVGDVSHGVLALNANGSFTYNPNPGFIGSDGFTYQATDGAVDSNEATVTITVSPVNDAPVAVGDGYSTAEDSVLSVPGPGVLGNDSDADGDTLTASLVSDVSHGVLVLNADGSFSYTPNGDYNGPDSFTYQASDGTADSNIVTVSIDVSAVNDAPLASDDTGFVVEGSTLNEAAPGVLGNDSDPEGNLLTVSTTPVTPPANGSLTLHADGSYTYIHDGSDTTSDSFVYAVCDAELLCDTATVNLTIIPINEPPVAVDDTGFVAEGGTLNEAAPGVLTNDSDPDSDPLTVTTTPVTQPAHGLLTLNADGSYTYVHDSSETVSDSFVYAVCDTGLLCDTATVNLTVTPVNDPPVAVDDSASTSEDTAVTIDVAANDSDVDGNLNKASANSTCANGSTGCLGAANGSLTDNGGGTITYAPNPDYFGSDSFVYEICDSGGLCATAQVAVTVIPLGPGVAEVRVGAGSDDAEEQSTGRVSITSGDLNLVVDKDPQTVGIRFSGVTIPQGATIVNATIQFKVDETTSGATALTIRGQAADDAPTFVNQIGDVSGRPKTQAAVAWSPAPWTTVGAAGPDQQTPDLAAIVQEIVSRPRWVSGNSLAIIITGTGARVAESYNGDRAGAPLLHVDYLSGAHNDAPVAVADGYSTAEDSVLSVAAPGVLDNDSDADGDPLTASLVSDVSYGVLTLNSNGSFSYRPDADFNGSDGFTYRAKDGAADSNIVTVSIDVSAVNDAPVAVADGYTAQENAQLTVGVPGVLGNDSDVDEDALTASLVSDVSHGVLALNANGSFTYNPNPGFIGTDSFTYQATDGAVDSNEATVTITVSPVNDEPVAVGDGYSTAEDSVLSVAAPGVLDNDSDADGDALTASLVSNVSHGVLALNSDGSFSYTPDADFDGTDSFIYVANDGWVDSNQATVTITVSPVNDAPVAVGDGYTTQENKQLTVGGPGVLGNDTDADGDALTASLVNDVSHGILALNSDGSFTYDPTPGFSGSDGFTYQANDGSVGSNVTTVDITVAPSGPVTFEVRVGTGLDDAEEQASGRVSLNSSDLNLVLDKDPQTVGIRFSGVTIPQGATIVNATIQFKTDVASSGATALTIRGQAADDAPTFVNQIGDVSGRPRTQAAVAWSPAPWTTVGAAGPDQRTPDLAAIVQEIVSRPRWVSGNSLVIIVTGTGARVAESYNGDQAGAPLLHIEYVPGG